MAKATLVAEPAGAVPANGFIRLLATGLKKETSHILQAEVGGTKVPPQVLIADPQGEAATTQYLFASGEWKFSIGLNPQSEPVAELSVDVQ